MHLIKIILENPVLPGREPVHLMEDHLGEPGKDDEHGDHQVGLHVRQLPEGQTIIIIIIIIDIRKFSEVGADARDLHVHSARAQCKLSRKETKNITL